MTQKGWPELTLYQYNSKSRNPPFLGIFTDFWRSRLNYTEFSYLKNIHMPTLGTAAVQLDGDTFSAFVKTKSGQRGTNFKQAI